MCRSATAPITTCSWWMANRRWIRAPREQRAITKATRSRWSLSVESGACGAAWLFGALFGEKILQECFAFGLSHPGSDLRFVIQGRKLEQVHHAAGGARFGIDDAEN